MTHIRKKEATINFSLDELESIENIMLDGMLGWEKESYYECCEDGTIEPASGSVSALLKIAEKIEKIRNQPALVVSPIASRSRKVVR